MNSVRNSSIIERFEKSRIIDYLARSSASKKCHSKVRKSPASFRALSLGIWVRSRDDSRCAPTLDSKAAPVFGFHASTIRQFRGPPPTPGSAKPLPFGMNPGSFRNSCSPAFGLGRNFFTLGKIDPTDNVRVVFEIPLATFGFPHIRSRRHQKLKAWRAHNS